MNASVVFTGDAKKYGQIGGSFKKLPVSQVLSEVLGVEGQKSNSPAKVLKVSEMFEGEFLFLKEHEDLVEERLLETLQLLN